MGECVNGWMGGWGTHKDLDISLGSLAELEAQMVISCELEYISSNNKILSQIEISRRKTQWLIYTLTHILNNPITQESDEEIERKLWEN